MEARRRSRTAAVEAGESWTAPQAGKAARPRRSDVSEEFRADVVRVHPPQVRSDPELMMVPVYQKDPERTR